MKTLAIGTYKYQAAWRAGARGPGTCILTQGSGVGLHVLTLRPQASSKRAHRTLFPTLYGLKKNTLQNYISKI